eukprot:7395167-Alexandrium_andersonii.AAC.1
MGDRQWHTRLAQQRFNLCSVLAAEKDHTVGNAVRDQPGVLRGPKGLRPGEGRRTALHRAA